MNVVKKLRSYHDLSAADQRKYRAAYCALIAQATDAELTQYRQWRLAQ